jgi:hypothetical protein
LICDFYDRRFWIFRRLSLTELPEFFAYILVKVATVGIVVEQILIFKVDPFNLLEFNVPLRLDILLFLFILEVFKSHLTFVRCKLLVGSDNLEVRTECCLSVFVLVDEAFEVQIGKHTVQNGQLKIIQPGGKLRRFPSVGSYYWVFHGQETIQGCDTEGQQITHLD